MQLNGFGFTDFGFEFLDFGFTDFGFTWFWHRGVVVITTAQLHSTKPELRFCAGSNPARNVWEFRDGEDLWQWSRLEIRLKAFRRSTIPQKQFIIIMIIIITQGLQDAWIGLNNAFISCNDNGRNQDMPGKSFTEFWIYLWF